MSNNCLCHLFEDNTAWIILLAIAGLSILTMLFVGGLLPEKRKR